MSNRSQIHIPALIAAIITVGVVLGLVLWLNISLYFKPFVFLGGSVLCFLLRRRLEIYSYLQKYFRSQEKNAAVKMKTMAKTAVYDQALLSEKRNTTVTGIKIKNNSPNPQLTYSKYLLNGLWGGLRRTSCLLLGKFHFGRLYHRLRRLSTKNERNQSSELHRQVEPCQIRKTWYINNSLGWANQ
jgi:hypothetical protein